MSLFLAGVLGLIWPLAREVIERNATSVRVSVLLAGADLVGLWVFSFWNLYQSRGIPEHARKDWIVLLLLFGPLAAPFYVLRRGRSREL